MATHPMGVRYAGVGTVRPQYFCWSVASVAIVGGGVENKTSVITHAAASRTIVPQRRLQLAARSAAFLAADVLASMVARAVSIT